VAASRPGALWTVTLTARGVAELGSSVQDRAVRAAGPVTRVGGRGRRAFLVEGDRADTEGLRDVLVGFGAGVFREVEPAPDGEYANERDGAPPRATPRQARPRAGSGRCARAGRARAPGPGGPTRGPSRGRRAASAGQ
jgi:hypothetical protein